MLTLNERLRIKQALVEKTIPEEVWLLLDRLLQENEDNRRRATELAWKLEEMSSKNES